MWPYTLQGLPYWIEDLVRWNSRLLTHGKLQGFQLCQIMETSGHYGVHIFNFRKLFCVLSFLISLSKGNVLILPGEGMISVNLKTS